MECLNFFNVSLYKVHKQNFLVICHTLFTICNNSYYFYHFHGIRLSFACFWESLECRITCFFLSFFCLVDNQNAEDMDGYVGFLAAVRRSYYKFVEDLSKKCKQTVQHHLDSVTSPYYHFPGVTFLDLSDSGGSAPDLPGDSTGGKKKGNRNLIDGGAKKKHANMLAYANTNSNHHSNAIPGADDLGAKSGSSYSSICSISAQYFAKMREVLIERNVPSELNSGFLTPWYVQHITMFYTCFSYVLHILFLFIHVQCNS